jgi:hypothetical protein
MPLADTLLRLAYGDPCYFLPRWTPHILKELKRTLKGRFGYTEVQVRRRLDAMQAAFPEALVTGYESLDSRHDE